MNITPSNTNALAGASPPFSNLRFLVAEDDALQREIVTKLLHRLGASTVHGASDGKSAMRALDEGEHAVDILVLDLAMPGMDGVELIQRLGTSRTPVAVILNSASGPAFLEAVACMAEGCQVDVLGVATKPLTHEKLRPLIEKYKAENAERYPHWRRSAAADLLRMGVE